MDNKRKVTDPKTETSRIEPEALRKLATRNSGAKAGQRRAALRQAADEIERLIKQLQLQGMYSQELASAVLQHDLTFDFALAQTRAEVKLDQLLAGREAKK